MQEIKQWYDSLKGSIEKVIIGKEETIRLLMTALLCGGHVLLEDVPGVGKTILARAVAKSIGGVFKRIQGTPDLMPTDIIGVSIYNPADKRFKFHPGPVIGNIVLIDEINRATPRSQSALLEAMENKKLSIEGKTLPLPEPFLIIATENPVEFEGTFPLPEAQKDRFFLTLQMGYPDKKSEDEILLSHNRLKHPVEDLKPVTNIETVKKMQQAVKKITVPESLENMILEIVRETREDERLELGASPRASKDLYRGAQAFAAIRDSNQVKLEDIKPLVVPVLLKRIKVKQEYLLRKVTEEKIIEEITDRIIQNRRVI